ncbi:MAG: peptidylprolyl isomerase [Bacilli bacterium]
MANKKDEAKKKEIKKVDAKKETKKADTKKVESKTKGKKIAKIEEVKSVPAKKERKNDSDKLLKFLEFMDKYRLAIYGVIGGVLVTVLVVIIIWPDRIAKLEDGTEPVAEIDGMILTADELYEDMKEIYSISALLDKIDNKILEEKYPETEEMNDELQSEAENYYNVYKQYQGISKEEFLSNNGFSSEKAFIEYLRLQYRRSKYAEDYVKSLVTESEINKFYEDEVYGDINTKHILVKVDSSATDEEQKEAEDLAKEIISKLDEGKTFDEVKEEYKDQITYEELGYKSYNANLESAYMEEMQKLEDNSYSKTPVKTSYGYHVVYRIDQKEKPALDDIKDEVIESIASKKSSEDTNLSYIALDKMREDAGLKFSDTVLEKKYETYMSKYK